MRDSGGAHGADGISPESKEFLILLFTDLREGLNEMEPGAVEQKAIFDALLDGLARGEFSADSRLGAYVAGLAEATDRENEYERVSLEHRALGELGDVLARKE